jgi:uncharacterized protein
MRINIPAVQLVREMFTGANRRTTVALVTSAICLAGWYGIGSYDAWLRCYGSGHEVCAAISTLGASFVLLGLIPALMVKFVLRERLRDYGLRPGDLRFAFICSLLVTPLVVVIGYATAQSPEFRAVYPTDPLARQSAVALVCHLFGQILWYAAWEFHFRGFLQHALTRSTTAPVGICVQMLASVLAHFGKPGAEMFGAIAGGLLWGALAWRTRSILAGIYQHWLLGASLDFFIFRMQ